MRRCRRRVRFPERAAAAVLAVVPLLPALAGPAAAEGATTTAGATAAGRVHCTITDPRLAEISGIVVLGDRMLAIPDGGEELTVLVLDSSCAVTEARTAPVDPYDPEDLAVSAEGTIWIADTGDNAGNRPTVALHALHADGTAELFRLTYPDGPHDSEALVLAPDGTPYLVTKEVLGASGVYRPAADLVEGGTVALERAATVDLTLTGTPGGPVGRAGQLLVTGGAVSRDGQLVALRTYTDAYLWPLSGSDVPAALGADPIRIPLPESPQGEAISFGSDDRGLVVASEGTPSAVTLVSTDEHLAPVAEQPAVPERAGATGLLEEDRSPLVSGVVAAAVATLAVWLGGTLRRRRA